MWGRKKILQNISLFLIALFIISTFCFSINSYAKSGTYGDYLKTNYERLKKVADDNLDRLDMYMATGGQNRYCNLTTMSKDREWIAYLYSKGAISKDEYNEYVTRYKLYYATAGITFDPIKLEDISLDDLNKEDLNFYFVEYIARKTMENMYNSMDYSLKNKSGDFSIEKLKKGSYDPWYLCPYGCVKLNKDNVLSKVTGFGSCTHLSDPKVWSAVYISKEDVANYEGVSLSSYKQISKRVTVRRDCSAYIGMVLANLGAEWLWDLDDSEYKGINSDKISKYRGTVTTSKFEFFDYNPNILKPGDIVVRAGHTEMFMGWHNRENYEVYHYSWGSTSDVENVYDSLTNTVNYKKSYKLDSRYNLNSEKHYTVIIRYKGNN